MMPNPPPGQGPIDPRGAFSPPPGQGVPPLPPPPPMMPQMMSPPNFYPPPKQSGGFVRGIFMTLATTIFGLSLMLNFYLLVSSGFMHARASLDENIITVGDTSQKVVVIPLEGEIDRAKAQDFDAFLKVVESDDSVKAVVLQIDSPGGEVTASDHIYRSILKYRASMEAKGRKVPVVVSMGSLGASGAYYAACGATEIYAERTTLTGSIGVLFPRWNYSKLMDKYGVEDKTTVNSAGVFKEAGTSSKPEDAATAKYIQDLADGTFATFKEVVKKARYDTPEKAKALDDIANGKIFLAPEAKALGLIDELGDLNDACARAAKLAGLSNMHVVRLERAPTLLESLAGQRANSNISNGGVTVHIDRSMLDDLSTPRMMYLWRGQ